MSHCLKYESPSQWLIVVKMWIMFYISLPFLLDIQKHVVQFIKFLHWILRLCVDGHQHQVFQYWQNTSTVNNNTFFPYTHPLSMPIPEINVNSTSDITVVWTVNCINWELSDYTIQGLGKMCFLAWICSQGKWKYVEMCTIEPKSRVSQSWR